MTEVTTVVEIHDKDVLLGCVSSGCSSCAGNSFCNVSGKTFTALNSENLPLKKGDLVDVYLPPGKTIASGFMILMVPLIMFLVGLFGMQAIVPGASDGLQAVGGFIGLALGFGIGFLFGKIKKNSYQPVITRIHESIIPQAAVTHS
jgi:positive regulator of sigma E activity